MSQHSEAAARPVPGTHGSVEIAAPGLARVEPLPTVSSSRNGTATRRVAAPESAYVRVGKPALDFVLALVLLIMLLPSLLLIAAAVALTMGRPVIFRQQRVGRDGRPFTLLKFRTMRPDRRAGPSTAYRGPERRRTHKAPGDPRITKTGRFLRKWSIDELPQLLNVLLGQMSLVGPRPELVEIVERYEAWQHDRHLVKPGITGFWQTSARSNGVMHEHVEIDLDYVDRLSFRTDCSVLLRTVPVFFGKLSGY